MYTITFPLRNIRRDVCAKLFTKYGVTYQCQSKRVTGSIYCLFHEKDANGI